MHPAHEQSPRLPQLPALSKDPPNNAKNQDPSTKIDSQDLLMPHNQTSMNKIYDCLEASQKVIPGYNFESLFRKKSHIRLARKKNKQESQKRHLNPRAEPVERETKNVQKGHWSAEENKLYHWFLELHNKHFIYKYLRRTDKIFKSMAIFIQSREAEQCRSHHQKMEKKYHTFYQILIKLRSDFHSSLDSQNVLAELEEQGYKVREGGLLSELELRNGEPLCRLSRSDELQDGSLGHQLLSHQQALSLEQSNILGENYQDGLDLKKIHY